jgi:hypothetical protein
MSRTAPRIATKPPRMICRTPVHRFRTRRSEVTWTNFCGVCFGDRLARVVCAECDWRERSAVVVGLLPLTGLLVGAPRAKTFSADDPLRLLGRLGRRPRGPAGSAANRAAGFLGNLLVVLGHRLSLTQRLWRTSWTRRSRSRVAYVVVRPLLRTSSSSFTERSGVVGVDVTEDGACGIVCPQ